MKMLINKFPLSNLKHAQYLHATQLQVANFFEQLEHENLSFSLREEIIRQIWIRRSLPQPPRNQPPQKSTRKRQ